MSAGSEVTAHVRLVTVPVQLDRQLRDRIGVLRNAMSVDVTIQELHRTRHVVDYTMTVVGNANAMGLVTAYLAGRIKVRPIDPT